MDEFARWAVFYKLEHFGERQADIRAAMVMMTMARLWGQNASSKIEDYMPFQYPKPPQTPEEQQAALLAAWGMTRKDAGWE